MGNGGNSTEILISSKDDTYSASREGASREFETPSLTLIESLTLIITRDLNLDRFRKTNEQASA